MAIELLENRLALAIMVDVVDNTNLGTAGSIFVTGHGIPGKAPAGSPAGSPPQELRVVGASGGFVQGAVTIAELPEAMTRTVSRWSSRYRSSRTAVRASASSISG